MGPRRRFAVVRLDLAAVKETAHAYGGKVNDVILNLVAGGLRALLVARGESVDGLSGCGRGVDAQPDREGTGGQPRWRDRSSAAPRRPSPRGPATRDRRGKSAREERAVPRRRAMFHVFLARSGLMRPVHAASAPDQRHRKQRRRVA
ncbi:wax ester/triacylglycerol synthase domain-containing protein [Micromonospora globispora]|uniref:wax ester/triacylglycerol synthase domain-containing protein n=1 Tax=Micromonospora globispora TaxID=1450148 RepID=UPI0034D9598C